MIGTRIRYYRKRSGLTLEQLADGICSVSYLSKFEHGEKASDEIVEFLCKRLGISFKDVDNHEEINEINRLLDEWYEEIRDRNDDVIEEKEKVITEKIANFEDPLLFLKFDLFKVRRLLIEYKNGEAKKLLKNIEKFKELFTTELEYFYYHFQGIYDFHTENYENTIVCYEKAEELLSKLDFNDEEAAELYYLIGLAYTYYYQVTKCINYVHKSLAIFEKSYNIRRIADCQTLLGISNRRIHNYKQAESHYQQALKFANLLNDSEQKAIIYHNLGFVQSNLDNSQKAIEYYNQSLKYKTDLDPNGILITIYLIAKEYHLLSDKTNSLKWINKGLDNPHIKGREYHYQLKILEFTIEHDNRYEGLLRKEAIPYFKKIKKWDLVTNYAEELANHYYDIGQYKKASKYYRLANNARKEIQ